MAEETICVDFQEQEFTVELKQEDIPCASVNDDEIGKLNVNQLKFWLKCRRIKQGWNKKELFRGRRTHMLAPNGEYLCSRMLLYT